MYVYIFETFVSFEKYFWSCAGVCEGYVYYLSD